MEECAPVFKKVGWFFYMSNLKALPFFSSVSHQDILDHIPTGVIQIDSRGIIVYTNNVLLQWIGYAETELIGRPLQEFFPAFTLRDCEDEKSPIERHYEINTIDNGSLYVKTLIQSYKKQGQTAHLLLINLLEEALWESQLKYRILADYSSDLITFLDSRGKVVFVSPSHEHIFGHPLQDYYQQHPFDYLHPDDIPHLRKWFYHIYESKQSDAEPIEFRARHHDGHFLFIRISCIPMLSKDGDILGFAIIGENIHNQKQTENLLRQSEKLSLIGELAAGIAHEIRNPLTALRGFTQLLQTHPEDSSKYTDIMLKELDRIHFIANELLLLAKPQGYQLATNDILSLLQDVITLLESQAILANVTISTHWETDIPYLLCEARQLKQVFINIIKNSVEAMPSGGCIHIEVKKLEQHVVIRFSDEGCGIPLSTLEKIGKPFYTTKETGTGLGLMISSKIIREHNGTLQLRSEMNQGTTIEITLPYMS